MRMISAMTTGDLIRLEGMMNSVKYVKVVTAHMIPSDRCLESLKVAVSFSPSKTIQN